MKRLEDIELQLRDIILYSNGFIKIIDDDDLDYELLERSVGSMLSNVEQILKIQRFEKCFQRKEDDECVYELITIWEKEEPTKEKITKEQELNKIYEMIASGEIPKEVYDKYLSKTKIGFMTKEEIKEYFEEPKKEELRQELSIVMSEIDTLRNEIGWYHNLMHSYIYKAEILKIKLSEIQN